MKNAHLAPTFTDTQARFATAMRDPRQGKPLSGVALYHSLLVNNLSEVLRPCFPVLLSFLNRDLWYDLVRDFLREHCAQTALFYEVPAEFVQYVASRKSESLPYPFFAELAHYEWMELALEVAEDPQSTSSISHCKMDEVVHTSAVALLCQYEYPVHQISANYLPSEAPKESTWILMYRDTSDVVRFIHYNRLSARLWQLLNTASMTGKQAVHMLQEEMQTSNASIEEYAKDLLQEWCELGLLYKIG